MRFALIDNSTLSGVQRLLGDIPVRNTVATDMDILCLESLVQAVIFYDEIVVLDDYKHEWRRQRHAAFPLVRHIPLDTKVNDLLLAQAKQQVESIVPRVEAGQFTDGDFSKFFELLRMNVTFTWDMQSSIFYLTQKMLAGVGGLDLEKYSQLADSIYTELFDKSVSAVPEEEQKNIVLIGSDGNPIERKGEADSEYKGLSRQADAFFAGLNWLAFRTIYLSLVAGYLQTDLLLHPIRQAFHVTWLQKLATDDPSRFRPLIEAMSGQATASLQKIVSNTQPTFSSTSVPLFAAWLVKKTGDPREILNAAFEMRNHKLLKAARQSFVDLEDLAGSDGDRYIKDANQIVMNLEKSLHSLQVDFSVATDQGNALSSLIKMANLGLGILPFDIPELPDDLLRWRGVDSFVEKLRGRYASPLYRSVVSDLASTARLGELHEKLTSRMAFDKRSGRYLAKTEEAKYRHATTHWKRPM